MEMLFQKVEQLDKETLAQNIQLNGSEYSISERIDAPNFEKNVLVRLSHILNKELENISSNEKAYVIGESAPKLVFLTPQLLELIM